MRQDLSKNMFVSPQEIVGYNAILNFINSGRGLRKTHNYLLFNCRRYIKYREQFAYVRRQQNEIDDNSFSMFRGLETYNADYIPAGSFRVVGNTIIFNRLAYGGKLPQAVIDETKEEQRDKRFKVKIKDSLKEGDEIAGYLFALSTAHTKKSTSYPNIRRLIFDEYLSETGQYLKDEVSKFVSLTETIFRDRDNVAAYLLGNTVSVVNPYYREYGVQPQVNSKSEITFFKEDGILIQNADRPLFAEYKNSRGIQRANKRTAYGRHIIDNVSIIDDKENCGYVSQKHFRFNFIAGGRDFGIYTFQNSVGYDSLYIGRAVGWRDAFWRTCDKQIYNRGNHFVLNTSKSHLKRIFERFSIGSLIYFEDIEIKQYILPYIF